MKDLQGLRTVSEFLRDGNFRHFEGVLDEEPPWVLRQLIPLLSGRVRFDDDAVDRIKELARTNAIIYAMKYRSTYDLHFLRMRFAELGLPLPCFVFDASSLAAGSLGKLFTVWKTKLTSLFREQKLPEPPDETVLRDIIRQGAAAVLFLVDERTSRSRYVHPDRDPMRIILELQSRMAASIAVVPIMILYDRAPRRQVRPFWESLLGDPDRPGLLRRLVIALRHWTLPEVLVGQPVYMLEQFEEFGAGTTQAELPFEVRQQLIASINGRIRVSRGPEKLSRTEIKERVLQDSRVQKAIGESITRKSTSEEALRKKAESYVDEIAADPHLQIHHFLYYMLKWMFRKVFSGIDLKETDFAALKNLSAEKGVIFVPCHKSHFDYLLIGFFCFINQMAVPYFAAGKNLSFWPVGPLLRNGGAFFLRRTFRGLELYAHVFAAYLKVLVKEKANIIFYMEGGRSRTGKMLPPKIGLLAFLLETVAESEVEDLTFVPTFIGYDQIPEETSFLRELAGREKEKETFFSVISARELLKKRFGKVYVRFDRPVSFREFCAESSTELQPGGSASKENRKFVNELAYHLMYGIVRAGVVSPVELVAASLVCSGHETVPYGSLLSAVRHVAQVLRNNGVEFADTLADLESATQISLGLFKHRNFLEITTVKGTSEPLYVIDPQKRVNLEFYKNSLVNYVWQESLVATVLSGTELHGTVRMDAVREDFHLLQHLLKPELIIDPLAPEDTMLEKGLASLVGLGWVSDDAENGTRILALEPLQCLSGILSDLLAVYYLVLIVSDRLPAGGLSQKEFAKEMLKAAEQLRDGDSQRSLPTMPMVLVNNALVRFGQMGILDYSASRKYVKAVLDYVERERMKTCLARVINGRLTARDAASDIVLPVA